MGNNYDSTIHCISTSETTKESLIFQAKGTWESIKSIYAQFRSERKETLRRRGLPPAWQLFEAKGWEYKQGVFWLFSYRCQHNYSDHRTLLAACHINRRMRNNSENLTIFSSLFLLNTVLATQS